MALEDHFRGLGDLKLDDLKLDDLKKPEPAPAAPPVIAPAPPVTAPAPTVSSVSASGVEGAIVEIVADGRKGRGFIVDANGRVATDLPLVSGAARIKATTADGDVFLARMTHKDENRGLALLEIGRDTPNHLPFGDIGQIEVGDSVSVAARSAGTFELGRALVVGLRRLNNVAVIQLEGADMGASGTPILSTDGNVVGVYTSRFTSTRNRVSFAVSINELKGLMFGEWKDFARRT